MITAVELSLPLQEQLRDEARRAYPRECCGLIEGMIEGAAARVTALRPMPNVATEADRFEIDPAAHIALLRDLRGTGREIIGCYHSHPNGRAEPSERDRESANDESFLWLIWAVDSDAPQTGITAFESVGGAFSCVPIVHGAPGTAGVPPASPKATRVPP